MLAPLVLLAAGKSERMGTSKALRPVHGEPLLAWQLRRFAAAGGRQAVVVLAPEARELAAVLNDLRLAAVVRPVVNPTRAAGPFSSVQIGLAALASAAAYPGNAERAGSAGKGVFLLPVDVPAPPPAIWRSLQAALAGGVAAVVPMHGERGGHPVLLGDAFVRHLLRVPLADADARLDRQLHRLPPEQLVRLPVDDPGVLRNLNTDADWRAWEAGVAGE